MSEKPHIYGSGETRISAEIRRAIRAGEITGSTAGFAPRAVQGNVVIVPSAHAEAFLRFCHANPKPCPLLAVGEPGDPMLPMLGQDIDMRTDVPRYRVFRDGELTAEPSDIANLWQPDFVNAPVHLGFAQAIGIEDLARPDFGDAPEIRGNELPLFWACGVTPQLALMNAKLPLAITHSPGCMLITDLDIEQLSLW